MKVGFGDLLMREYQNVINNLNTDMNSFLVGFKLFSNLENPLYQNLSHLESDFSTVRTFGVKFSDDIEIEVFVELLDMSFNFREVWLYLRELG